MILYVYFAIIVVLFYVYLHVRDTTPREGKLTRTIKRLDSELGYYRELAER